MKISLSALIALICLTFIWGFNWLVMKSVLPYVGAFDFAAMRCLLGTALLFLLLKIGKYNMTPPPFLPTFLLGILQTAGMVGFAQWALVEGGAGKVAILTYTMPFWVIILARVFLNEQLKRQHYFATSIAVVGMLLLLQPWSLNSGFISSLLAVCSGLSWGASAVYAKRLYQRYQVGLLSFVTWQMLWGSLVLLLIALVTHQQPIVWHPYLWSGLLYNAVLATAVAWSLWMFILKHVPASIAGLSSLAVPVCGGLLSWWLLGERPNTTEFMGILLILFALLLIVLPSKSKRDVS